MGKAKTTVGSVEVAPTTPVVKAPKAPSKPKAKPVLFYASKDKYQRAIKLAGPKGSVKKEYDKLGGAYLEGRGHAPVGK